MTAFVAAVRRVLAASDAPELFGVAEPARRYRQLARLLHPDRVPPADRAVATDAFVRLTTLWHGRDEVTLGGYRLGRRAYAGDLCDLYDVGADRLLKLPRNPANNDLVRREARSLRVLEDDGDPRFLPYVPRLVDTFPHDDPTTGARRQCTVVAAVPNLHSLAMVRTAYPSGLDPRDVAWMWRRLLVALGFVHRTGLVHGAVLPDHVLIEPEQHGVVLVDWCYSAARDEELIPALVPAYADWYPPEVREKRDPGPGTDIALAARCMTWLMGTRAPEPLRRFAAGCQLPALKRRPDDAWRLLDELDEVLEKLYGPRTFRPFTVTTKEQ
jgi:hypothetical protein